MRYALLRWAREITVDELRTHAMAAAVGEHGIGVHFAIAAVDYHVTTGRGERFGERTSYALRGAGKEGGMAAKHGAKSDW